MDDMTRGLVGLIRRWRGDVRGSSMITTALTLPILIIFIGGVWYLFLFMAVKQSLNVAVNDAARYLGEEARYWNINPANQDSIDPFTGESLYPVDYWDQQARRVVINRLRSILLPNDLVTDSVFVTVTEPLIAVAPDATQMPIDKGLISQMCSPKKDDIGEYRWYENTRFIVYASYKVPLWQVRLPYLDHDIYVTLHDRAVGYLECPRWVGSKLTTAEPDKSRALGREGPHLPWRATFPAQPYATVTERPTAWPTPTPYPPTETPGPGTSAPPTVTAGPTNTSFPPPAPEP
jgi:Flp pilus assembly protein TadG